MTTNPVSCSTATTQTDTKNEVPSNHSKIFQHLNDKAPTSPADLSKTSLITIQEVGENSKAVAPVRRALFTPEEFVPAPKMDKPDELRKWIGRTRMAEKVIARLNQGQNQK